MGRGGGGEMLPINAFTSCVSTALSSVSIAYFQFPKFGHTQIKGKFRLLPFGFSLPCLFCLSNCFFFSFFLGIY